MKSEKYKNNIFVAIIPSQEVIQFVLELAKCESLPRLSCVSSPMSERIVDYVAYYNGDFLVYMCIISNLVIIRILDERLLSH